MIEAYHASGQTQAAFAEERGLKISTLRAWLYRRRAIYRRRTIYRRRAEDHAGPGRIEPVRIVGGDFSGATMTRAAITVRWPQGIELAVELDAAGVERLVRELLAPCLR